MLYDSALREASQELTFMACDIPDTGPGDLHLLYHSEVSISPLYRWWQRIRNSFDSVYLARCRAWFQSYVFWVPSSIFFHCKTLLLKLDGKMKERGGNPWKISTRIIDEGPWRQGQSVSASFTLAVNSLPLAVAKWLFMVCLCDFPQVIHSINKSLLNSTVC